jgi:fatty-acyl-CoA synthase
MTLDIAQKRAELTPERPAVFFEGRWHSYAEMNARAERLAARPAACGIHKGDRVSILAENHLAHLDLILAAAKLGFIYTPFNYRLSAREQQDLATYVRPKLLFYDAENAAKAEATGIEGVGLEAYEEWLSQPAPAASKPELNAEDIQMILFTGGTTGTPKGAMLSYRQGFYNAVNTVFSWGLRADDCVIQTTPCFHAAIAAFTVPLLHLGAKVVLQRHFDPGEYLHLVGAQRATILFMVPTMFQMLSAHPDFAESNLTSVRWAISGGASCPAPVREAFEARGIAFKQGYGLSEAGVNCFTIELDDARARPLSVGKPMLHAEAVIRHEDGAPVERGEVGELTLRGPHVFSGYFERPEATAEVLRNGWLWTGDLAKQDAEGFFYIVGRRKEMFISGGENVFPVEIENILYAHPAVAECAVFSVPDARWGEVGVAAVVARADLSAEDIRSFLKERLATYKVPKQVVFYDNLPKSGAGKILKGELAAQLEREGKGNEGEQVGL